jgi:hypothetical protein
LQKALERAKVEFRNAWIRDVEEITGRSEENIRCSPYRYSVGKKRRWFLLFLGKTDKKRFYGFPILCWRIKHRKYPKFGIKYARQMQSVLDVGSAGAMSVKIKSSESYFKKSALQKLFITVLALFTTGTIVIEFISGNFWTAMFKLLIAIMAILLSLVFGSMNGNHGGKRKLGVAEEVSQLLEEWKDMPPIEEVVLYLMLVIKIKCCKTG